MHRDRSEDPQAALPTSLVDWRCAQLLLAGFPVIVARRLAQDARVDLHAVLKLVDRGCPPALAMRILAPLDGPP